MAGYMYNDSALFVTGSVALSSSLYMSWGSGTGSAATVGIRQNANGTLEFRDNATGSWTEFGSSLDDTTFGDSSADVYTFIGQITASQGATFSASVYIADNTKVYFGANNDASIEYDEDGTDELRLAGAAITFEQDATFDNDVTLGVAATDVTTVTGRLTASQGITSTGKAYFNSNVTLGNAAGDVTTVTSQLTASQGATFSGSAYIADNTKLYFGANNDASIEYDEDGNNRLIIDAPAGGVDITGSLYVSGSVYANEFIVDTVTTTVTNIEQQGSTKFGDSAGDTHQFTGSVHIANDNKVYFGANNDASIEYDENGTDELRFAGKAITFEQDATFDNDVTLGVAATDVTTVTGRLTASQGATFSGSAYVADNTKLYFGANNDAYIEYDEDGRDRLIISGSAAGIEVTGSAFHTGSYNLSGALTITGPSALPMLVMDDSDASAQIGRAHVGYDGTNSDMAIFAHQDKATQTNFALRQRSNGQTELNAVAGQSISFKISSANKAILNSSGHLNLLDDIKLIFGTGEDASIEYEDSTNRLTISGSSAGTDITGSVHISNGNLLPYPDNSVNLGSSTYRWANLYTADLHLKNERGDWTIVEEEDYLCVVNNKTNKRYKMMLEEIED